MRTVKIDRKKPIVKKKDFFHTPSVAEVKRGSDGKTKTEIIASKDLVAKIDALNADSEYLVIDFSNTDGVIPEDKLNGLIPASFYPPIIGENGRPTNERDFNGSRASASSKFMRHGKTVDLEFVTDKELMELRRQKTGVDQTMDNAMHVAFRKRAFDGLTGKDYLAGYSFRPVRKHGTDSQLIGDNNEARHVPLTECLSAAHLLWYWRHSYSKVDIKAIDTYKRKTFSALFRNMRRVGMRATMVVPSKTLKKGRHKVDLDFIPIYANDFARALPFSISTRHLCEKGEFDRGYLHELEEEGHNRMYFDHHVIMAYFALSVDYMTRASKDELRKGEASRIKVMIHNSPFAIPTEDEMHYDIKLMDNVLIKALDKDGVLKLYRLNQAEREILHWARVAKHGHEATFFQKAKYPIWKYDLQRNYTILQKPL
ncbi:MAG: hypothetical protein ABIG89_05575 [Candidatus Woesearchaeota archaeon]